MDNQDLKKGHNHKCSFTALWRDCKKSITSIFRKKTDFIFLDDSDTKKIKQEEMVRWFSPSVLWDALKRSIISAVFGQYADFRILQIISEQSFLNKVELQDEGELTSNECIWIDYVADLGDGFNSTYSIAYLLGKEELEFEGEIIPQGNFLIMGGDQVYPTPSKDNYNNRMIKLYSAAYPRNCNTKSPLVYILPGNHDWYDGLNLFSAFFCNRDSSKLGESNWNLKQSRSYFFIKLPNNWRIFGVDTQLGCNIDIVQSNYFKNKIAADQELGTKKIIIFTPEPAWLESEHEIENQKYNSGIGHIIKEVIYSSKNSDWKSAKIYAVIAGDVHHYSRYKNSVGTNFITSGGGGAYLYPTHNLKTKTHRFNCDSKQDEIELMHCYPSKEDSKKLAGEIWWKFPFKNMGFCLAYSAMFFLIYFVLLKTTSHPESILPLIQNPLTLIFSLVLISMAYMYDNNQENIKKKYNGIIHGIVQCLNLAFWIFLIQIFFDNSLIYYDSLTYLNLIVMITASVFCGLFGGIVFGVYLYISTAFLNRKNNDSFSSLRSEKYKNFIKIKIEDNKIKIYSFGIKEPPVGWKKNQNISTDRAAIVPEVNEKYYEKIEEPIIIDFSDIKNGLN